MCATTRGAIKTFPFVHSCIVRTHRRRPPTASRDQPRPLPVLSDFAYCATDSNQCSHSDLCSHLYRPNAGEVWTADRQNAGQKPFREDYAGATSGDLVDRSFPVCRVGCYNGVS